MVVNIALDSQVQHLVSILAVKQQENVEVMAQAALITLAALALVWLVEPWMTHLVLIFKVTNKTTPYFSCGKSPKKISFN